jgi:hypothetical protein
MQSNESIVVINAGSSSIKFSLYSGAKLELTFRGKIENLYSGVTHFAAEDAQERSIGERRWPDAPLTMAAMRFCSNLPIAISMVIRWWPWATASSTAACTTAARSGWTRACWPSWSN